MATRNKRPATTPEDILSNHTLDVVAIANRLRTLVKDTVPEMREAGYPGWHAIGFRHPSAGYVCAIFPFEGTVRFLFEWGVDDAGVLQPGGKQVRYIEIAGADEIPEDTLAAYVLEAIALGKPSRRR